MTDERWIEAANAATLRMVLAQERAARQEVEHELARRRAGLARQNERIVQLEWENTTLRQNLRETRRLVTARQD